jgi:Skp family chaperone for outer membrane proteins
MLKKMMTLCGVAAALAIVPAVAPVARADNTPAAPAPGEIRIGIANPTMIASQLRETKDLQAKRQDETKTLAAQQQQKQQQINDLTQELQILQPGTPKYDADTHDLLTDRIGYDAWSKETQVFLERQEKTDIKHLFGEIHDAITQVAQQKGLNIVIADQGVQIPDKLDDIDLPTLEQLISRQTILYSDGTLDISGDVTTLLDQNYLNQQTDTNKPPGTP